MIPLVPFLGLLELSGPYPSLERFCALELRGASGEERVCEVARQTDRTAVVEIRWRNVGGVLAVRGRGGWYVSERALFVYQGQRRATYHLQIVHDPPGVVVHGVQSYWRKPRDGIADEHYCIAIEVVCRTDGARPRCSDPLAVAGQRNCYDRRPIPSTWDWERRLIASRDGTVEISLATGVPPRLEDYDEVAQQLMKYARSLGGRWRLR